MARVKTMLKVWLRGCVAICLVSCGKDELEIPADYFEGRTIRFTPDEPLGGISVWYYDLDVDGVEQRPDGGLVEISSMQGCNDEALYSATGWKFEGGDTIVIDFGADWEKYTLADVDDPEKPTKGRFEYDSSVDVQMKGDWVLGANVMMCLVSFSTGSGGGAGDSLAYCNCMHCPVTSCTTTSPDTGTCCSQATFVASP
jgi:hypothetical protein